MKTLLSHTVLGTYKNPRYNKMWWCDFTLIGKINVWVVLVKVFTDLFGDVLRLYLRRAGCQRTLLAVSQASLAWHKVYML